MKFILKVQSKKTLKAGNYEGVLDEICTKFTS